MAGDRLPWDEELDAYVEIDLACARLARELRDSARRVIGLLPAPSTAPVQNVARQLAIAVSRLTRTAVVILDPEASTVEARPRSGSAADAGDGSGASGFSADDPIAHALFGLHRVDPLILLCAPERAAPPGAKAELLKLMLRHVEANVAHGMVLVDMKGLVRPGEMLGANALLEGIIVVGHAAKTDEPELLRTARRVPPELALGVLLGE